MVMINTNSEEWLLLGGRKVQLRGIKQFGVMFYFLSCMLGIQVVIKLLFNFFVYRKYFALLFKKNPQPYLSILGFLS